MGGIQKGPLCRVILHRGRGRIPLPGENRVWRREEQKLLYSVVTDSSASPERAEGLLGSMPFFSRRDRTEEWNSR